MPGGFPIGLEVCNGIGVGANTSNAFATELTAGSANTKSAWTQLIGSTSYDCCWVQPIVTYYGEVSAIAVDFGIGPSGSETPIISNFLVYNAGATLLSYGTAAFPLSIPAGTRISVRCQDSIGSDNGIWAAIELFDGAFTQIDGMAGVDAIGYNSSTSRGTLVTAGSSTSSKGSYTQMASSTTRDYAGIMLAMDCVGLSTPGISMLCDIAIGPSGSEQAIISNLNLWASESGAWTGAFPNVTPFIPIAIPAGTRIAIRTQATTGSAQINFTLYGVYK